MDSVDAFRQARHCLCVPIPQMDEAADLLSHACDAYLAGDIGLAHALLRRADIPEVHQHASRLMGAIDRDIHRLRPVEAVPCLPGQGPRMPTPAAQRRIFERDGFRCRFCGCRVVLPAARKRLREALPGAIQWGRAAAGQHAAFFALSATADHVLPYAKGGTSDAGNMVTACWGCNFGRGSHLVTEMGLTDPTQRQPVCDEWDGLSRILPRASAASAAPAVTKPMPLPVDSTRWFAEFGRRHPGCSARLQSLLASLERFQVSPAAKDYLIFRMRSPDDNLQIFGVSLDGTVNIPWLTGNEKARFRPFAETLAAALPDAIVTESAKQWIVKNRDGSLVRLTDLLSIAKTVEAAFAQLHATLHAPG